MRKLPATRLKERGSWRSATNRELPVVSAGCSFIYAKMLWRIILTAIGDAGKAHTLRRLTLICFRQVEAPLPEMRLLRLHAMRRPAMVGVAPPHNSSYLATIGNAQNCRIAALQIKVSRFWITSSRTSRRHPRSNSCLYRTPIPECLRC
jgi:hypothetical protein